ncbi:DUF742 domain-containing protein [Amycolatopsis sp. NBC_01480]|uniref:DUF742 domain-containing protein n=1 Tax=Amycolatopsis sp. NBC_01480 TaxID=2903562 RepID=UPI002E2CBDCC|nr:DUF742 domain-containing protein [Amycolatopsis sp. NBC_01480]
MTERLAEPESELEPEPVQGPVGARFPSAKVTKRRAKSKQGKADPAKSSPADSDAAQPEADAPVHSPTGARFPAPQLADRLSGEPEPEAVTRVRAKFASAELAERMAEVPEPDHSTVGRAGARFPTPKAADRFSETENRDTPTDASADQTPQPDRADETNPTDDPDRTDWADEADQPDWADWSDRTDWGSQTDPTDQPAPATWTAQTNHSGRADYPGHADRTDAAYSGTLGEGTVRPHLHSDPTEPPDELAPAPDFTHGQWDDWAEEPPSQPGPRTLVRPYVLTRGRTQSRRHLAIEALVSTCAGEAQWDGPQVSGEFRSVRTMCYSPRSVAEVAATLSVPLGVARILLDDMAELGLVRIHENDGAADGRPALELMERVLSGLQRL